MRRDLTGRLVPHAVLGMRMENGCQSLQDRQSSEAAQRGASSGRNRDAERDAVRRAWRRLPELFCTWLLFNAGACGYLAMAGLGTISLTCFAMWSLAVATFTWIAYGRESVIDESPAPRVVATPGPALVLISLQGLLFLSIVFCFRG